MKKLAMIILVIVALGMGLGLDPNAEAANWKKYVLADSAAAEDAATYYITTGSYSKGFNVWGYCENNPTGATDQIWTFGNVFRIQREGAMKSQALYTWITSGTTGILAGAWTTTDIFFHLSMSVHGATGELADMGKVIVGDSLKITYLPQNVTGGNVSLVLWLKALD